MSVCHDVINLKQKSKIKKHKNLKIPWKWNTIFSSNQKFNSLDIKGYTTTKKIFLAEVRREVFCKKGVLRNLRKFTWKHLCQSLFVKKVARLRPATLLKMRPSHRCFSVNFAKFLRTPFLTEHLQWLFLNFNISSKICWRSITLKRYFQTEYKRNEFAVTNKNFNSPIYPSLNKATKKEYLIFHLVFFDSTIVIKIFTLPQKNMLQGFYGRDIFKTLSNIYDGVFWENNELLNAGNCFCTKHFHHRCLIRF